MGVGAAVEEGGIVEFVLGEGRYAGSAIRDQMVAWYLQKELALLDLDM